MTFKRSIFWNYFGETFDVDNIALKFFDSSSAFVGMLDFQPDRGTNLGSQVIPSVAYALTFPTNVQFVNALLSGTNSQVDFQNIGFTGELSSDVAPVPALSGELA